MTCAASWRRSSSASAESRVMIATRASRSTRAARSFTTSSTLMASAALARPGPIAAAISAPVTGPGNWRTLPSGNVMAMDCELDAFMAAGLAEGQSGGNLVDREIGKHGTAQDGDARAARRGEIRIGSGRVEHACRTTRRDDQMHRPGIVADRVKRLPSERHNLAEAGAAGEVARRGAALGDDRAEASLGSAADDHRRDAV